VPVPLFEVPEWHPSKMREVDGASTLMAAIRFKNATTNQGIDVRGYVGEEATLGQNVWGGCYSIVWGGELIESKERERETGRRPWWPPFGRTTQQSINSWRKRWGKRW